SYDERRTPDEKHNLHAIGASSCTKTRRELAVVSSAPSKNSAPRARASARATSRTNAGSLRRPRCGAGARYGASVSTKRRSAGQSDSRTEEVQFRNVIIPLNEK